MIPIENTLHGSVHENYDHLLHFNLPIVGETSVRIVHNLIAAPGVAFRQDPAGFFAPGSAQSVPGFFCRAIRNWKRVPFYDTAGSVKMVMAEGLQDAAGIASAVAAETYGARILRRSIEDDRQNFTRFFALRRPGDIRRKPVRAKKGGSVEDFASVYDTQRAGSALPLAERLCFARSEPGQNRIPASARQALGVPFLPGLHRPGETTRSAATRWAILGNWPILLRVLGCYPAWRLSRLERSGTNRNLQASK